MTITLHNVLRHLYPDVDVVTGDSAPEPPARPIPQLLSLHTDWSTRRDDLDIVLDECSELRSKILQLITENGSLSQDQSLLSAMKSFVVCPICLEIPHDRVVCLRHCGHTYCKECFETARTKFVPQIDHPPSGVECPVCCDGPALPYTSTGSVETIIHLLCAMEVVLDRRCWDTSAEKDLIEGQLDVRMLIESHAALACYESILSDLQGQCGRRSQYVQEANRLLPVIRRATSALMSSLEALDSAIEKGVNILQHLQLMHQLLYRDDGVSSMTTLLMTYTQCFRCGSLGLAVRHLRSGTVACHSCLQHTPSGRSDKLNLACEDYLDASPLMHLSLKINTLKN
ncbi:hypothetical protein CVT26_009840 [Gymnopilus dilepis]|uniref:RING-type domain-containing protein n=1 Tax=Gymnopilus dilepis TaxID=231916 RepID=A0A409WCR2_9AGAR|nr:hypothetical protein CVT26_009840 [Gymnopilus dilepis]